MAPSVVPSIVSSWVNSDALDKLKENINTTSVLTVGTAAVAAYCLFEQLRFSWWRKGKDGSQLPGPDSVVPVVGGIMEMVKDPYGFWEKQRKYSFPGMSWNSLVGTFTIFVTDPAISRHVFNHNSKDTLLMALHPVASTVLGARNIAFLHGPEHKALRKSFLALFTRRALGVYVTKQDQVICNHVRQWLASQGADAQGGKAGLPCEMRTLVRDMNAMTSQEVFAGPYLDDPVEREQFGKAYITMTDAFVGFPVCLPGTAVYKGRQARFYIIKVLTKAAGRAKAKMATGAEPECLLDFWAQQVLKECEEAKAAGTEPPFYAADAKMADSMMDFLFASQDASTASLVWCLTMLAERPDVLAKVREEQKRLRPDPNAPLTQEILNEAHYTRQVVKEVLRYRPPAPMVPQLAQQPFQLTENYTAPKGTMIIPSLWSACMQGYEEPHKFDPERFGPERKEDIKFASNYLVFGHGPHYCVGKEYAINHLTCFLARVSTTLEWTRVRSKVSDETRYMPTLYPGDSVFSFKWAYPSAPNVNKNDTLAGLVRPKAR